MLIFIWYFIKFLFSILLLLLLLLLLMHCNYLVNLAQTVLG